MKNIEICSSFNEKYKQHITPIPKIMYIWKNLFEKESIRKLKIKISFKSLKNNCENDIDCLLDLSEFFEFSVGIIDSNHISTLKISKSVITVYYKALSLNTLNKF